MINMSEVSSEQSKKEPQAKTRAEKSLKQKRKERYREYHYPVMFDND